MSLALREVVGMTLQGTTLAGVGFLIWRVSGWKSHTDDELKDVREDLVRHEQDQRALARLPDSRRIFTEDGERAARWSDPELRDW